jgi:molybdopterin synthase catalytic subunit
MTNSIRLQREAFDIGAEVVRLTHGDNDIGAVVSFTGICRSDENGEPIAALKLEHYPGMAEAEIARHVEAACERWPLLGVAVIHRYGRLEPGEVIVLVATASRHREAAFAAAEFVMDYLKTRAPFWKQIETPSGDAWIEAKPADDSAAARWTAPVSPRASK